MPIERLQYYWRIAGIVHVMLLAWMFLALSSDLNIYYPLLFGGEVLLTVISLFFVIWLKPVRLERLRPNMTRYRPLLVVVMFILSFLVALSLTYLPHYAFFALLTPLTFGLLLYTLYEDAPMRVRGWMWVALVIVLVVVIGVRVYSLIDYPPVHRTDEGWALSWGVNYALTGEQGDPLMTVPLPSFDLRFNLLPRFVAVQGLWHRLVGIGYWESRLFSFLLNLIITALTATTAYNWYGRSTAWFTAAAMFGSTALMRLVSTRPDSGFVLTLAAALFLVSEGDKRNWLWLHFVAGITIGLGVFAHLHAAGFGAALVIALYLPRYVAGLRQRRFLPPLAAVLFALGGAIIGGLAFIVIVLPNPEGFFHTTSFRGNIHQHGFGYALVRNIIQIYLYSNVGYFLIFLGLIGCVLRRKQRDWVLLLLVVMSHLMLSIIAPSAYEHYLRPVAVIYSLLIGALLGRGVRDLSQHTNGFTWINTAAAGFVLTILIVQSTLPSMQYILRGGTMRLQPTPAITWIQEHIHPGDRILVPTEYALWLPTYTNMRSLYIESLQNRELWLDLPGEQIWDAVDARFIVFDTDQNFDMLPKSLFASGYLRTHGYIPIAEFREGERLFIIYARQG